MGWVCSTHIWGIHTKFWLKNLKETDRSENQGLEEMIILEWILGKWRGKVWTGLIWLRIGTSGEIL
jgi:hypothetical protein